MSDEPQTVIRSVSRIADSYLQTVRFLADTAGARSDILRAKQPRKVTPLPADRTDPRQLRMAFPFEDIDKQIDDINGDESQVGSVGDLQVVATQSDLQALCIRALTSRYTPRRQRKLDAAHRTYKHSSESGYWHRQHVNKIQSLIQMMISG